jgi:hypothetical protein
MRTVRDSDSEYAVSSSFEGLGGREGLDDTRRAGTGVKAYTGNHNEEP